MKFRPAPTLTPGSSAAPDHRPASTGQSGVAPAGGWLTDGRAGALVARFHRDEGRAQALTGPALRNATIVRWLGAFGAALTGIAGLTGGAVPLHSAVTGLPLVGIFARAPFATVALGLTGTFLLTLAWIFLGRYAVARRHNGPHFALTRLSLRDMWITLVAWLLPFIATAPLYSKDVYSYIAFGVAARDGANPYRGGPMDLLPADSIVALNVPFEWRHTPAQYGPGFVTLARQIAETTGDHLIVAVGVYRFLALISFIAIAWAVTRLAIRCRVAPATALWLGVANPLMYVHLLGGVHNESIMIALMLVGLEVGLRGVDAISLARERATTRRPGLSRTAALALVLAGGALIALGASIKLPAAAALGFLGVALARARGPRPFNLLRAGAEMAAVLGAVLLLTTVTAGTGFSWLTSTGAATSIPGYRAVTYVLASLGGLLSEQLGLGDATTELFTLTSFLGLGLGMAFLARQIFAVWRGRLHPIGGFGAGMLVLVLLFPVIHPWYILWALAPLASWASDRRYRRAVVALTVFFIATAMPQGGDMPVSTAGESLFFASVVTVLAFVGLALVLGHNRQAWHFPTRTRDART